MNADEVVWFDLVTDEEYPDSEVSISKRSPSRRMHGQTFRFSGSSVVVGPQDSRAGGFCPEQVGNPTFLAKSDLLAVSSEAFHSVAGARR